MEKYAVELDEEKVKKATQVKKCPSCGATLETPPCSSCGTKPFEKKEERNAP